MMKNDTNPSFNKEMFRTRNAFAGCWLLFCPDSVFFSSSFECVTSEEEEVEVVEEEDCGNCDDDNDDDDAEDELSDVVESDGMVLKMKVYTSGIMIRGKYEKGPTTKVMMPC